MRTNKRVSAIVTRDNNILLIHRRKSGDEYWVVPGGGVEEGESLEQGLIREVQEETSLDINKFTLLDTNKEILTFDNTEKTIEHYIYYCELNDGEPVLGGPEAESNSDKNWYHLEWVNIDSLQRLDLYPNYTKQIINKVKSKMK